MNASHVKIASPNELKRIKPSPPNPIADFPILRAIGYELWEAEFEAMLAESRSAKRGSESGIVARRNL